MKKLWALCTVLALLCTAAGAWAETGASPDLYDVYEAADSGRTWLCTAVPVMEGVAVASPVGIPEESGQLEIWDGAAYRAVTMVLLTSDGTVLVILYETDGEDPGIPAYAFVEAGVPLRAGDLAVRSGDWMKSRINRAVYDISELAWAGHDCFLVTLSGDTSVGAPLLTGDGKVAGIVAAEYAEGLNRYVVLTVQEITYCILEAADLLAIAEADTRPEGYAVTVEKNEVTFDWSGVELPEAGEGETLYHIVTDNDSAYLTYVPVTPEMKSLTMLLTPGRIYFSGLMYSADIPDDLPEQVAVTILDEAEPLTDYQFSSSVFAVAELPEDGGNSMPVPAAEVTEELLRSGRACIYSVSSYEVSGGRTDCSLLITLTTPMGDNFRYESGWYYDPSVKDRDEWYVPMADTGLLEILDCDGYPDGVYEMTMYIDGKLADTFRFELGKQ